MMHKDGTNAFQNADLAVKLAEQICRESKRPVNLMEVCGTHTMSIFRSGIRSLLPESVRLISGPGCPVCVTDQKEIDTFLALTQIDDVIITTFGDLVRVPGTHTSLQEERAKGRDIRVVYSTMDALEIAVKNPGKNVVFLGVGFETTAPTVAAAILAAEKQKTENFFVVSAHKLVPPALEALLASGTVKIDGFILPGHVSVIIGKKAYSRVVQEHRIPGVICGFEPTDILQGILMLVRQVEAGKAELENAYTRVVTDDGNPKAMRILREVFETTDAPWRGIGIIPKSGLLIRKGYARFDALEAFSVIVPESKPPKGCACGAVLTGAVTPPQCPLFRKVCTPEDPVGPCMVSSEGTCAAYYRYHFD
ncbi:MAG: hydrogenase formation protein HypD [Desulfobacterales bacterium CG07_land_8_20_14_0_80_52_14]|nr:MAG: hydrogenase formation protein HypD [Desulfobacterales bacterium CG07_land_8_20_14_0_80_52_14]